MFEYLVLMFLLEKYQSICPKFQFLLQIEGTLEKNSKLISQLISFSIVASVQIMEEKFKFTLYFSKLEEINYSPYRNI